MKKKSAIFLTIVLCLVFLCMVGCKAEDEIAAIVTPNPDAQTVVVRQDGLEKYIEVTGTGVYETPAEYAVVTLELSGNGHTAQEAQESLDGKKVMLLETVKANSLSEEDVVSNGVVVGPVLKEDGKMTGSYAASETISVNIQDLEKALETYDTLIALGISDGNSLAYTLTNTSEAYRKALNLAIEDAKGKAKALASEAGIVMGKAMEIIETSGYEENDADLMFESSTVSVPASVLIRFAVN